jgi:hypothetical protein
MTDWKQVAAALAPDVPADAVERAIKPLERLDADFRRLVGDIPLETEPAFVMLVHGEDR